MVAGCLSVYSTVFAVGYCLYAQWTPGIIFTGLAMAGILWLMRLWNTLEMN